MNKPRAYVFAGANASGKSTFITFLFENKIIDGIYINADLILKEELKLDETKENYLKAFRIESKRLSKYINQKKDLVIEIVSSTNIIKKLKKAGYYITYIFIGTETPKINSIYLVQRVSEGGHDVSIKDLIRRWKQSLENLKKIKEIVDCLILIDNSNILNSPTILKSYFQKQLCYINNDVDLSKIKWISFFEDENSNLINLDNEAYIFCQFIQKNIMNFTNTLNKDYKEKNKTLLSFSKIKNNKRILK